MSQISPLEAHHCTCLGPPRERKAKVQRTLLCDRSWPCAWSSFCKGSVVRISPLWSKRGCSSVQCLAMFFNPPAVSNSNGSCSKIKGTPCQVLTGNTSAYRSGQWWVLTRIFLTPVSSSLSKMCWMSGRPRTGSSGFGQVSVSGRRRVPSPAPRTKAVSGFATSCAFCTCAVSTIAFWQRGNLFLRAMATVV